MVCDILPNCRAFYIPAVLSRELIEEQNTYVKNGLCDYIVTCSKANIPAIRNSSDSVDVSESNFITWIEHRFDLYDLTAECTSPANGRSYTYYLYQLKSLAE